MVPASPFVFNLPLFFSLFLSPRFPIRDFSASSFVHPCSHLPPSPLPFPPPAMRRNALESEPLEAFGGKRIQRSERRLTR